ncbi:MAG: YjgN family protein [Hylemonella sp.]|nr:YjgN family protein [Hylemonella sp.]MDH5709024.1 YjgN family protein [Hylemonella sp.]
MEASNRPESAVPERAGPAPSSTIAAHPLVFSGGGGEYFRVWIVNVLLSILTLGLYTPWARRRTAQYFYSHTQVADSPLEFTAPLRKMVFGFLLFMLLYLAFEIATKTGQETASALLILGAAVLAPYLWASAMRFRLGSTRWRGLQLLFTASWKEVYLASWPVFAIALYWIATVYTIGALAPEPLSLPPATEGGVNLDPVLSRVSPTQWGLLGLGLLLSLLAAIRIEYNYKGLLVRRAALGTQQGRWKPVYGDFVRVWLATVGVFLLGLLLGFVVIFLLGGSLAFLGDLQAMGPAAIIFVVFSLLALLTAVLLISAPARAYREARMFQLVWNNIGLSHLARFKCRLSAASFVWLRLKNVLLTLLTLGLYRPFARVNEYRMKLESVTLHVKGGLDQVSGELSRQQSGGMADMMADAAGLDLIG